MDSPPAPDAKPPKESRATQWRRHFTHLLRHGPFAMAASSLPGLVNYIVVIYLAYARSLEEAGTYRLLTAYFALIGLASLTESAKIAIRATAERDKTAIGNLLVNRSVFSLATLLIIGALHLGAPAGWDFVSADLAWLALIAAIHYPLDLYRGVLQARREFMPLFFSEAAKYGVAFAGLIAAIAAGATIHAGVFIYFSILTAFHVALAALWLRPVASIDPKPRGLWRALRSPASRESRLLSVATIPTSSLEHIDKMLIGHFLGLFHLGVYTLGFSTGRFIYNMLKPALYIYYHSFVEKLPSRSVMIAVFVSFSIFGAMLAGIYGWAVAAIPQLSRFRGSEAVSVVLFLSYGVAMVDAVYTQAYAINKDARSAHILAANLISTALCVGLFAIALMVGPETSLVLFAAHYALRHAAAVAILWTLKRRRDAL